MVGTCTVVANTCVGAYEGKDSQDIRAYHQAFDLELELVPMQQTYYLSTMYGTMWMELAFKVDHRKYNKMAEAPCKSATPSTSTSSASDDVTHAHASTCARVGLVHDYD